MEIVKKPAYLRFVKYEHWLAFAGVGILIFHFLISFFFKDGQTVYIVPLIYFAFIATTAKVFSPYYLGISDSRPVLISLVFFTFGMPLLLFSSDNLLQGYLLILLVVVHEVFWRGIFVESLKRFGFSKLLLILLSALLSTLSYTLYFRKILIIENIPGFIEFSCFSLVASLLRINWNIYISLFWSVLLFILVKLIIDAL